MKEEMKEEIKEEIKEEMTEKTSDEAGLEPADVFEYFRRIAAIPHGSFHTKELSDYLENFAKEHSLEYVRDDMGNLIIARPASPGCEGAARSPCRDILIWSARRRPLMRSIWKKIL